MLLTGYRKEIFRPECNPNFESIHCIAHLDNDISQVIPYLNAELGGFSVIKDPPSVMFRISGKLIAVHADRIAVNALKDEVEAEKIVNWLKNQINDTWERRQDIVPSFENAPQPQVFEILKLLPKTNCKECGQMTCTVFASMVADNIKDADDCPPLNPENREKLQLYLKPFAAVSF